MNNTIRSKNTTNNDLNNNINNDDSKIYNNTNNNMTANGDAILPRVRQNKLDSILSYLPLGLGKNKPVVAVFRLDGVIGKAGAMKSGLAISSLNQLIEKMFQIKNLDAICLCINSPGGSPVQSELIANRIINLAKINEVPVYSFVEDVAASGGYWLACIGEKIYASQSSIIGSIGVISSSFGFHEAIEKLGIERRVYTQGSNKSVLDPFKPAKESDIKIIHKLQKEIHQHFINTVKERRAGKLTQDDDILFSGEFWSGQIALDYGLIDGIDDLYSFIHKSYGDNVKIEHIESKQPWFKKKLGLSKISANFAKDLSQNIIDSTKEYIISNKFDIK